MSEQRKNVVVLGAGMTGLSAAYRLSSAHRFNIHVIDKESSVGGLCRSFTEGEFILDHGPHKFYSLIDGVMDELRALMGSELLERDKKQSLYLFDRYFSFPLKMGEMVRKFPPQESTRILASYAQQIVKNVAHKKEARTYEEFITERFGKGLFDTIFAPMARKIYGPPSQLDRKLAEVRISSPGLLSVVKQLVMPKVDGSISAPNFLYPKHGYGRIPKALEEKSVANGVQFHLNSTLLSIGTSQDRVTEVVFKANDGTTTHLPCDHLVYTIPLSFLDNLLSKKIPTDLRKACRFMSYRNVIIYYFLLKSEPILPSMWVFFPEEKYRFGRLSEMVKFSPHTTPPGHTALMVDFTCTDADREWSMDDEELGTKLEAQLLGLGLFKKQMVLKRFSRRVKNFYPVYDVGYQERLHSLRSLEKLFSNLLFLGRLGDFNYNNADQCLDMGYRTAHYLLSSDTNHQDWEAIRETHFNRYKIVD